MKNLRLSLLWLLFMNVAQNLMADMIPTGQRRVSAYVRLANIDQYPNYVFLAYSQDRFGDSYSVLGKKSIGLNKQSHTTIYAIPKDEFKEGDVQADSSQHSTDYAQKYGHYFMANPTLIRSGTDIYPHDFIPESDSASRVDDILLIKSLTPDTLILVYDSAVFTYASGRQEKRPWQDADEADAGHKRAFSGDNKLWLTAGGIAMLGLLTGLYVRNRKR